MEIDGVRFGLYNGRVFNTAEANALFGGPSNIVRLHAYRGELLVQTQSDLQLVLFAEHQQRESAHMKYYSLFNDSAERPNRITSVSDENGALRVTDEQGRAWIFSADPSSPIVARWDRQFSVNTGASYSFRGAKVEDKELKLSLENEN